MRHMVPFVVVIVAVADPDERSKDEGNPEPWMVTNVPPAKEPADMRAISE